MSLTFLAPDALLSCPEAIPTGDSAVAELVLEVAENIGDMDRI